MDLSVVRRKLDESNTLHYFTPEHFVDDVLLMFRNCATFNYVSGLSFNYVSGLSFNYVSSFSCNDVSGLAV